MVKGKSQPLKKDLIYSNNPDIVTFEATEEDKALFEAQDKDNAQRALELTKGRERINIWISGENMKFLREKAQHAGTTVAGICALAVSDYCDEQRIKYGSELEKLILTNSSFRKDLRKFLDDYEK